LKDLLDEMSDIDQALEDGFEMLSDDEVVDDQHIIYTEDGEEVII